MAVNLLRDNPELRPFVLSNVRLTGTRISAGAYGSVEEVTISGAVCAAKKIHDIFQDRSEIPAAEIQKASTQFVLSRLATARAGHGATADKPSRFTGPRNGPRLRQTPPNRSSRWA